MFSHISFHTQVRDKCVVSSFAFYWRLKNLHLCNWGTDTLHIASASEIPVQSPLGCKRFVAIEIAAEAAGSQRIPYPLLLVNADTSRSLWDNRDMLVSIQGVRFVSVVVFGA